MNNNILDKTLVYINSSNGAFINNGAFDFIFDLTEPIKNALYVSIVKSEILLNPSQTLNGEVIEDGDPIFIYLKDYNRIITNIQGNNVKCFDLITLNLTEKFGAQAIPDKNIMFKTEYSTANYDVNDINTFVLNPTDPNLKRFDIKLFDKKFNQISKSSIVKFNIVLCVYHNRKKITQF